MRNLRFLAPLAAALCIGIAATPANANDAQDCDATSPDRVIRGCSRLIEQGGSNKLMAIAYGRRGSAFLQMNAYDRALSDYTKVIQLDPSSAHSHYSRGYVHLKKGSNELAIADITNAIELAPRASYYLDRGVAHARTGRTDLAIIDYTSAIKLEPRFALAYHNRGIAHFTRNNLDSARRDLTESIGLSPQYQSGYLQRGRVYIALARYAEAVKDLTEAIRLEPADANAYFDRGRAYGYLGLLDESIADTTQSIRLQPSANAYSNRGIAYRKKGMYARSLQDLDQAVLLDGRNYLSRFNRAVVHAAQGNFGYADADINMAAKEHPRDPDVLYLRSVIRDALGQKEGSAEDYRLALELKPALASAPPPEAHSVQYFLPGAPSAAVPGLVPAVPATPAARDPRNSI